MELIGECKEEFKRWLRELKYSKKASQNTYYKNFYSLPSSMQYGVIVDFFDSLGIIIELPFYWGAKYWKVEISRREEESTILIFNSDFDNNLKTRCGARQKAIKEANEIRNKQLND